MLAAKKALKLIEGSGFVDTKISGETKALSPF